MPEDGSTTTEKLRVLLYCTYSEIRGEADAKLVREAGAAGGTMGPEVVPLKANSTSTAGGAVVLEGTFAAEDYLGPLKGQPFDALHPRIHESQIYVVVPTKQHPAGEIKGPIRPEMLSE